MQENLSQLQLQEGSDFSFPSQLLWCKILVTKTRFTGNPSFAALAISKLEEARTLLPATVNHNAPLPLTALLAQANILMNNYAVAQQLAAQLLLFSKTSQSTISSIEAHNLLGKIALHKGKYDLALEHARKGQAFFLNDGSLNDDLVLANNYLLLSQSLFFQGAYDQAFLYGEKIIALANENSLLEELLIKALLWSAFSVSKQKKYAQAMQLLLEAKRRAFSIQHQQLANEIELAIGMLYSLVSDFPRAIDLFTNLQSNSQFFLNDRRRNLVFHLEWGKACYYTQEYEQAQSLFNKVISRATGTDYHRSLALAYAYLSCIATAHQKIPKALKLAKNCNRSLTALSQDVDGSQINLINLGNIHFQLGKYSEAVKLTSRGIATAKRLQDELSEIRGFQLMAKIFQQQKDFKNAFLYQSISSKFYEDFFLKNARNVIRELEYEFELTEFKKDTH